MAIDAACGSCGRVSRAPDDAAGKRFKCPGCGGGVVVPVQAVAFPAATVASDEAIAVVVAELTALRRSLRRRTWGLGLAVGALAFASILAPSFSPAGHSGPERVIEAEEFRVIGPDGQLRASLGRSGHPTDDHHASTGLFVWEDGRERGSFVVDGHGWGVVTLTDASGAARAELTGEGILGGLAIYDAGGDLRASTAVDEDGDALLMIGPSGGPLFQMGTRGRDVKIPFFDLVDEAGVAHSVLEERGPRASGD